MILPKSSFSSDFLPSDIVSRCNGRLFITVTQMWPNPSLKPVILSHFDSKEHLVDAVAASCFIPLWSARRLATKLGPSKALFADGGILAFMPPIGDIRISPLPRRLFLPPFLSRPPHIHLSPQDLQEYPMSRLATWILRPAPEPVLRDLYKKGFIAANKWIDSNYSQEL